ncbi:hypothetical protein [Phreatobacter sp.]|uniref:hypothetical protein n=1 Tax=Phreatobacter sp. TaxID=1966341 RepID=UPI003F7254B7
MRRRLPLRLSLLAVTVTGGILASGAVRANEICQAEFQPMIQSHQQVMQQTQAAMPRGRPTTFQQARASAQRACNALGNAQASFQKLKAWLATNQDFCRIPDQMVNDVNTGLANVTRNRQQACNGVAQLDRQRRQAEAGGGNPFAPNVGRRPQLDLRTPGAL